MIRTKAITALMADAGITSKRELARRMKVKHSQLIALLRPRDGNAAMTIRTLDRLCTALQCHPGDILEWKPEPSP